MAASEELEEKAKEAFVDDDFEVAVDLYTQAISLNPHSADLFADRAQANLKLNYFTEAVCDTNKAIEFDRSMAKAYFRKGIACMSLEEYHTAKVALEIGASFSQDDSRFTRLITECDLRIKEENAFLDQSLRLHEQAHTATLPIETLVEFENKCKLYDHNDPAVKPKYRHEFYQKPDEVVVTIFAKGIPARNVIVQCGEQILSVIIDVLGEDTYHFQTRLFGKILKDKCRYQVLSTKIEIRLVKADAINWASLECNSNVITAPQKAIVSSVGSEIPEYPTSKPRTKDWDKFEAQVKKEEREEKKLERGAGFNKMFKQIYQQADEDTRRAMNKSYVESKGTVLSTNWKKVGSKKVECRRPLKA